MIKNNFYLSGNVFYKGITFTNRAKKHITKLFISNNAKGIRLNIKKLGCAGLSYNIKMLKKIYPINKNDLVFFKMGFYCLISIKLIKLIDGTEIDFISDEFNNMFKFNNPQAKYICGCGKSFNIKSNIND